MQLFLLEEFWGQGTGCHLGIMSSVGGDQVQALNDLFSGLPEIDQLLHMQLVEKALKELSVDEEGAVALSSCISAQGSLSVEEKERLQKILREKVWEMGVKSGRRPYQGGYTALDSFLTDAVWDALQRGPFSSSSTNLFQHLWSLGLRLPSEATSATMTAALEYIASEPKNLSLFALYCTLKTVKKMWTSFANKKRKVMLLLGSLPSCPDGLPEEIGKRVTLKGPIVPSKIVGSGFADLANSIPNRESHEAVKQYKLATLYGGKC